MTATWNAYSTDVFGYIAERTPENERLVAEEKVREWLEDGRTPRDIFLTWNQGNTGECRAGVNRYGVPYDSCAYAEKALKLLAELTEA